MGFVILEITGETARSLYKWDWPEMLDLPYAAVRVDAFDTKEELEEAVAKQASA